MFRSSSRYVEIAQLANKGRHYQTNKSPLTIDIAILQMLNVRFNKQITLHRMKRFTMWRVFFFFVILSLHLSLYNCFVLFSYQNINYTIISWKATGIRFKNILSFALISRISSPILGKCTIFTIKNSFSVNALHFTEFNRKICFINLFGQNLIEF